MSTTTLILRRDDEKNSFCKFLQFYDNKTLVLHERRETWLRRINRSPQWRRCRSIATQKRDYSERKKTWEYVTGALCTAHVLRDTSVKLSADCFEYNKILRTQARRAAGIISRTDEFDLSCGLINIRPHTY